MTDQKDKALLEIELGERGDDGVWPLTVKYKGEKRFAGLIQKTSGPFTYADGDTTFGSTRWYMIRAGTDEPPYMLAEVGKPYAFSTIGNAVRRLFPELDTFDRSDGNRHVRFINPGGKGSRVIEFSPHDGSIVRILKGLATAEHPRKPKGPRDSRKHYRWEELSRLPRDARLNMQFEYVDTVRSAFVQIYGMPSVTITGGVPTEWMPQAAVPAAPEIITAQPEPAVVTAEPSPQPASPPVGGLLPKMPLPPHLRRE